MTPLTAAVLAAQLVMVETGYPIEPAYAKRLIIELRELREQKARARNGHLRQLNELRADIADVRAKNRELVTENAALVAAVEASDSRHIALRYALEDLVDDNTKRGIVGGRLSWARHILVQTNGGDA